MENIYIVIIVIVCLAIYLLTNSKKENFTETNVIDLSKVNSMDDKTAINTLAQISKSLMNGTLKVLGDIDVTGSIKTQKLIVSGDKLTMDTNGNINNKGTLTTTGNTSLGNTVITGTLQTSGNTSLTGTLTTTGNVSVGGVLSAADMSIPGNILNKRNFFVLKPNNGNNSTHFLYTDDTIIKGHPNYVFNSTTQDARFLWYEMGGRICNAKNNKCLTITGTTLADNGNQGSIGPQITCVDIQPFNRDQIFIILNPWWNNHVAVCILASHNSYDAGGGEARFLYYAPSGNLTLRADNSGNINEWRDWFKFSRIYVG